MDLSIKYSVIIPHYNNEDGLDRLLSSIPTRSDIQVLIVDDRSDTKLSKEVVRNSNLPNVSWYINDKVKSAGTCRNIGLERAIGEYLIFADSDDWFTRRAFNFIDDTVLENPNSDLLFFNVTSTDEDGGIAVRHIKNRALILDYINKIGAWYEERLRFTHYVPWGKVIKRKLVEQYKIEFDQTIIANDGVFSLKVGKAANEIFASDDIIYCVTYSPESLTRKKDVNKFRVRLEVYARYFNLLSDDQRRKVRASPLPLVYMSLNYGIKEFFRTLSFLRESGVGVVGYFDLNFIKIRRLLGK